MFEGTGKPLSEAGMTRAAQELNVALPALWAVMTVETKGCGFLADRRPQILFERHIFHKRTNGRFAEQCPDLCNPVAGGYGASGAPQHERLARAVALDRKAALESTSWGLGQVMGFNAAIAGFTDVEALVNAMCESEDMQFGAMVAYIKSRHLAAFLQAGNWDAFAEVYNGPDFRINNYGDKLQDAASRYTAGPLPDLRARAAQLYLTYLNYRPGPVDGVFGKNSSSALMQFQKEHRMNPSGTIDDKTFQALEDAAMKRPVEAAGKS